MFKRKGGNSSGPLYETKMGEPVAPVLEKFASDIAALKAKVEQEVKAAGDIACVVDDFFYLRYVQSAKGDIGKAVESVKETLAWRKENLKDLKFISQNLSMEKFVQIAPEGSERREKLEKFQELVCKGFIESFGNLGCPAYIFRSKYNRLKEIMAIMDAETVTQTMLLQNEIGFQVCARRTRETGKIAKVISIIDFRGFSIIGKTMDIRFVRCMGASSRKSAAIFPQLLGKFIGVNSGPLLSAVIKLGRTFMSKHNVEKQAFCPVRIEQKGVDSI